MTNKEEAKKYINLKKVSMETISNEIDVLIKSNRKMCWEAEYENGQYCIGEEKVKELIRILNRYSL